MVEKCRLFDERWGTTGGFDLSVKELARISPVAEANVTSVAQIVR